MTAFGRPLLLRCNVRTRRSLLKNATAFNSALAGDACEPVSNRACTMPRLASGRWFTVCPTRHFNMLIIPGKRAFVKEKWRPAAVFLLRSFLINAPALPPRVCLPLESRFLRPEEVLAARFDSKSIKIVRFVSYKFTTMTESGFEQR